MTHEDEGNYAAKRPGGAVDERLARALQSAVEGPGVPCRAAEAVARELGRELGDVGAALDRLELKITSCQLGLFGYETDSGRHPAFGADDSSNPAVADAVRDARVDERLPCRAAWEIGERFELTRLEVASVAEVLGVKIKPCQFGAF